MSIPSPKWTCPVCGFETDSPDEPRFCFIYDCPHRAQIPMAEPEEPAAEREQEIDLT